MHDAETSDETLVREVPKIHPPHVAWMDGIALVLMLGGISWTFYGVVQRSPLMSIFGRPLSLAGLALTCMGVKIEPWYHWEPPEPEAGETKE